MTNVKHKNLARFDNHRQGSMLVLLVFVMIAILAVGSLAINKSYLNTAASDLKTATDLAAKSGAIGLGQTQSTVQAAAMATQVLNEHNSVFGSTNDRFQLVSIKFGNAIKKADGTLDFKEDHTPANAVKVVARYPKLWNGSLVPLDMLQTGDLKLEVSSIAVRTDNDVCLVIDRSASMSWDLSNTAFSYPGNGPDLQNYFTNPDPVNSRWAALTRSVDSFLQLIKTEIPGEIRMGLVSYSSNYQFGIFTSKNTNVDQVITTKFDHIVDKLQVYGEGPIIGDTDISAGLLASVNAFNSPSVRSKTGNRIVVLFTDGLKTVGGDPISAAKTLADQNYTVHVISFSAQADKTIAARIASTGNGIHLHADNENQLKTAFKKIAESFPGTLLQ